MKDLIITLLREPGNPPLMSKSRSVVSFDYDNDGDLDLIVTDFFNNIKLWENTSVDAYFLKKLWVLG